MATAQNPCQARHPSPHPARLGSFMRGILAQRAALRRRVAKLKKKLSCSLAVARLRENKLDKVRKHLGKLQKEFASVLTESMIAQRILTELGAGDHFRAE
eukprot:1128106-Prorocentrum_lima.AAC.1